MGDRARAQELDRELGQKLAQKHGQKDDQERDRTPCAEHRISSNPFDAGPIEPYV
jgi:hypothetical protein